MCFVCIDHLEGGDPHELFLESLWLCVLNILLLPIYSFLCIVKLYTSLP